MTRWVPRVGTGRVAPRAVPVVAGSNQSAHHSHTLPVMLCSPNPFGGKASTGAVPAKPSAHGVAAGKVPWNTFIMCAPSGSSSSPHGNTMPRRPPRAANSHSASVGRRVPLHAQNAWASFHDTWTTGWSSRPSRSDCGPSG